MNSQSPVKLPVLGTLQRRKSELALVRERARLLFQGGATSIQVADSLSVGAGMFLVELLVEELHACPNIDQTAIRNRTAVVAIGGSGRGDTCPYSDLDLLFLNGGASKADFEQFTSQVVRALWDAGVHLGHSVRTLRETLTLARTDTQVSSGLTEARHVWGSQKLTDKLKSRFIQKVMRFRRRTFMDDCLEARAEEREEHGSTTLELQPNVKSSLGGLREYHLFRWIAFAFYENANLDYLKQIGALSKDDASALLKAYEFLLRVRIDLHFHAGREQDILTRAEQLRLAEIDGIDSILGQRPVERYMQKYFQHSRAMLDVVDRFVDEHKPRTLRHWMFDLTLTHRANGKYRVGPGWIDVIARFRDEVSHSLSEMLRVYHAAALYNVQIRPQLLALFRDSAPQLPRTLDSEAKEIFLQIFSCTKPLGPIVRSLFETQLLDVLIPEVTRVRCLLQFNQYHSYTVDEHTLRAVEIVTRLHNDEGPLGKVYREIQHKEILHLALLLHDLGKGFEESHSEVGRRIALAVAARLNIPEHRGETLALLVLKHLDMANLAFRRDFNDPDILLPFTRAIGSSDTLRMLYVLTYADISAVGPGVWTDWKAELLGDMYSAAMYVLEGRHYQHREAERVQAIRNYVIDQLPPAENQEAADFGQWVDRELTAFPMHYLMETPRSLIVSDLEVIRRLNDEDLDISYSYDSKADALTFRLITHERYANGCFHRTVGVLTAKRLEILSAQISTSRDGFVVDSFAVVDQDFAGNTPPGRIDEITDAIRQVLRKDQTVETMFQQSQRFEAATGPMSNLPTRVVIDNNTSANSTVLDVFAHDRPGLLYTVTRALYELELSVVLAKIATHFDQVVDVFYVTDADGNKIEDGARLRHIRDVLTERIETFIKKGYREFSHTPAST